MKFLQMSLQSWVNQVSLLSHINLTSKEKAEVVDSFSKLPNLIRIGMTTCGFTNFLLTYQYLRMKFVRMPIVKNFHLIVVFAVRMKECERAE